MLECLLTLSDATALDTEATRMLAMHTNGVASMVRLLSMPDDDVAVQSGLVLGNISVESGLLRDLVLASGVVAPLAALLLSRADTRRRCTWVAADLCRGDDYTVVAPFVACLTQLLQESRDTVVLTDAAWGLAHLWYTEDFQSGRVVSTAVVPRLVELLQQSERPRDGVTAPWHPAVLRVVGRMATTNEESTVEHLIDAGTLPALVWLLHVSDEEVRQEAWAVLSNMAAGTRAQTDDVIRSVPNVVQLIAGATTSAIHGQHLVLTHLIEGASQENIAHVVEHGAVPELCAMLHFSDQGLVAASLRATLTVLSLDKSSHHVNNNGTYAALYHECGGVEKIQRVLLEAGVGDEEAEAAELARQILETFFGGGDF